MIRRERRDGGEARGNEEREKGEDREREKGKGQKGVEMTFEEEEKEHHLPLLVQLPQRLQVLFRRVPD